MEEFQDLGILPEAMVNYLALLGWSPGGSGDEVMTHRRASSSKFSLKKVNSSPAAFDYDKLDHINSEHIKRLSPAERRELARPSSRSAGWALDPAWQVPDAADTDAYPSPGAGAAGQPLQQPAAPCPSRSASSSPRITAVDQEAWHEHVATADGRERCWRPWPTRSRRLCRPTRRRRRPRSRRCVRDTRREAGREGGRADPSRPGGADRPGPQRGIFEVMETDGAAPRWSTRLRRRRRLTTGAADRRGAIAKTLLGILGRYVLVWIVYRAGPAAGDLSLLPGFSFDTTEPHWWVVAHAPAAGSSPLLLILLRPLLLFLTLPLNSLTLGLPTLLFNGADPLAGPRT